MGKTPAQAPETLYLLVQITLFEPKRCVIAQDHEFVVTDPQRPLKRWSIL
jgi:hypothetical protein